MKSFRGSLLVALCLHVSAAQAAPFAYIVHEFGRGISVLDTATNMVTVTVPVFARAELAVHPAGTRVYAPVSGGLAVMDTASNTVTDNVPSSGFGFVDVAVNPAGTRVYAVESPDGMTVIDAASNAVIETLTLGQEPARVVASNNAVYVMGLSTVLEVVDVDCSVVTDRIALPAA